MNTDYLLGFINTSGDLKSANTVVDLIICLQ